ncbi:hypothetical protein D3C72_2576220 [compost metagenome]
MRNEVGGRLDAAKECATTLTVEFSTVIGFNGAEECFEICHCTDVKVPVYLTCAN